MIDENDFTKQAQAMATALYRVGYSLLRSDADTQDAVQSALMNVWRVRAGIDPRRFRGYLTRAVVNQCRDIQRYRRRVMPTDAPPEAGGQPEDTGLREALDRLPERLRTPLLLCCMEGYTDGEAAQALGITRPALKSRLYRARKALMRLWKEEQA